MQDGTCLAQVIGPITPNLSQGRRKNYPDKEGLTGIFAGNGDYDRASLNLNEVSGRPVPSLNSAAAVTASWASSSALYFLSL